MSNAQHTPGPWTLIKESPPQIIKPGQHDICEMSGAASHDGVMADAHLISAAPELLEALQWMVQRADEGGYPDGRCLMSARAAISAFDRLKEK